MNLRDKYCIVGLGNTRYGKLPGFTTLSLLADAIQRALEDAGVNKDEVDAVLTKAPTSNFQMLWSAKVCQRIGIQPRVTATLDQAGASNIGLVGYAMMCIEAGMCSVALIAYGDNPATGSRSAYTSLVDDDAAYGLLGTPACYAMIARRHMHEFGTTSDQLAAVAIATRNHAALNSNAQFRETFTLEEYRRSRFLAEPLRLLDCCPVSDGAAAIIVTSTERARDLRQRPVYVSGIGQSHAAWDFQYREQWTTSAARESGADAFRMAGIGPADIDCVQLYDCFTIVPLITLEDYGFCKKGEGGSFVESGRIDLTGDLPMNTSGGLLSETGMPGMQLILEAVRQLRGECGERQVGGAHTCLVSGQGGVMTTHATLVLRN